MRRKGIDAVKALQLLSDIRYREAFNALTGNDAQALMAARAGRLEAAARELLARLPRCEWQLWDDERQRSVRCDRLATHMDLNFAECDHSYWCDEHKAGESLHGPASEKVEWADAAAKLAAELEGE